MVHSATRRNRAARNKRRSKSFEIVAKCGKVYTIPRNILVRLSEPIYSTFAAMLEHGGEKKLELLDWDCETISRFIYFLCEGDYLIPLTGKGLEGRGARHNEAYTQSMVYDEEDPRIWYDNLLLVHVKLYALAQHEDFQVEELRVMALERLKTSLEELNWYSGGARDFVELMEYVCCEGVFERGHEPVRQLVLGLAEERFNILKDLEELRALWEKERLIGDELMERMAMKFCDAERDMQYWRNNAMTWREKVERLEVAIKEKEREREADRVRGWVVVTRALNAEAQQLDIANKEKEREADRLKREAAVIEALKAEEARQLRIANEAEEKRQLRVSNEENEREADRLKEEAEIANILYRSERIDIDNLLATMGQPQQEPRDSLPGPNRTLYLIIIMVTFISFGFWQLPQTVQPFDSSSLQFEPIDGRAFQGVCQYYEGHSWAGSASIFIGEKPLIEACRVYIPGTQVEQPSYTIEGTIEDIDHFSEVVFWVESALYSIEEFSPKEESSAEENTPIL